MITETVTKLDPKRSRWDYYVEVRHPDCHITPSAAFCGGSVVVDHVVRKLRAELRGHLDRCHKGEKS